MTLGSTTRAGLAATAAVALFAFTPVTPTATARNAPAASGVGGTVLQLLGGLDVPVCAGSPNASPTLAERVSALVGGDVEALLDALPGGGHSCPG